MPPTKEPWYKKYAAIIKDAIFIIGIVISLAGWITTKAKNEAVLETTIKYNTEIVKKLEIFMDKQIELNGKQATLNGQYSQFISSHKE
jgi:hypothetical protein